MDSDIKGSVDMKNIEKVVAIIILISSIILIANINLINVKAESKEDYKYIENNSEITIVKYIGDDKPNIKIPEMINGKTVVKIAEKAFYNCSMYSVQIPGSIKSIEGGAFLDCNLLKTINISEDNQYYVSEDGVLYSKDKTILVVLPSTKKTVSIPTTVTKIEKYAFSGCEEIISIILPDNVTSIGSRAFEGCTALANIKIPSKVQTIEEGAFYRCINLEGINVDENNQNYLSEEGILYTKNKTILVAFPAKKTTALIPRTVTRIESYAFSYCEKLNKVEIPESVTCIGARAFENCTILVVVKIPSSVTSIEEYAFSRSRFSDIEIPSGITTIEKGVFSSCKIRRIKIPESVTSIGDSAFEFSGLLNVVLPDGLKSIGSNAFHFCYFESIEIPSSVEYIAENAFSGGGVHRTFYGEEGSYAEKYATSQYKGTFETMEDKEREIIIKRLLPYILVTILFIISAITYYFIQKSKTKMK